MAQRLKTEKEPIKKKNRSLTACDESTDAATLHVMCQRPQKSTP
jgi:hypothetical protein